MSILTPTNNIRSLNCGTPYSAKLYRCGFTTYPGAILSKSFIIVSIAFPLLAVIKPLTFSATNALGFFASTNSAKCLKRPPLVPFNPGCFQIIEKS